MNEPTLPEIDGFKAYLKTEVVFKNGDLEDENRYRFDCLKCDWSEQGVYSKFFAEHMPAFYNSWTRSHVHKNSGHREDPS